MDAAVAWSNSKLYLFSGSAYSRWDATTGACEAAGLSIAEFWSGLWSEDLDAALWWGFDQAFFFKDSDYCRYDGKADAVAYVKPIADAWPGLWPDGVDAAINWTNGKAYFFRDGEYLRWDIGFDRKDDNYPKPIAGNWNGVWEDGVDAALYPGGNEVYFFKGEHYRIFDIALDRTDGTDYDAAAFAPRAVAKGLFTPARALSLEDAAALAAAQGNAGRYSFKDSWMKLRRNESGAVVSIDPKSKITVEPVRVGDVDYLHIQNRAAPRIDNLDPRMVVALERLGRWLNADRATVDAVIHLGIGHGRGAADDCHNQGRALDLAGIEGSLDGTAFALSVKRDWGLQPEGDKGRYRLDADAAPVAFDLFKRAYAFGTFECEGRPGNAWPATEIGEGGMVICPDYWGDGSAGSQKLRQDHNDHIHMQVGPTRSP